jgi:SAM-dependent methyltransferase
VVCRATVREPLLVAAGSMERGSFFYRTLRNPTIYSALQSVLIRGDVYGAFVQNFVNVSPGMDLLDLGCGTGQLSSRLLDCSYLGIEPNPKYVAAFHATPTPPGHDMIVGDASTVATLGDRRFDRVILFAVLHHVDDTTAGALLEAASRSLKPGGWLVTMDPCLHPGQHPVAKILARMDRGGNVRQPEEYRALATNSFDAVEQTIRQDMLRLPYTHLILTCRNADGAIGQ